jgi:uncharacterized protein DUF4236
LNVGFRFRRRITIGPGLRLNLSKSGVSASVGTRGAWLTVGSRGARETIGVPGTGISYTEQQSLGDAPATVADDDPPVTSSGGWGALIWLVVLLALAVGAIVLSVTAQSA